MTGSKKLINEVFVIRAVACLAVVLLHAVSSYLRLYDYDQIRLLQLFLMFGTPTFVFISELLLSNAYSDGKPKGFFRKRFKYIMIPYLIMAVFYAWVELWNATDVGFSIFTTEALKNIFIGDYHGYFILIIFQFYLLHFIYLKYIDGKIKPVIAIVTAFFINVGYLGFFNVIRLPEGTDGYLLTFWNDDFKLLFIGWIFYFVVAFYCGKNFEAIRIFVRKYIVAISAVLVLSIGFILFNYFILGFGSIHSKRFDLPVYTMSIIGIMIYLFSKIKKIPNIIMLISRYAFGIYLLHQFYFRLFEQFQLVPFENSLLYIATSFIASVTLSILTTYALNNIPFGEFAVGQVKSRKHFSKNKRIEKTQTSQ